MGGAQQQPLSLTPGLLRALGALQLPVSRGAADSGEVLCTGEAPLSAKAATADGTKPIQTSAARNTCPLPLGTCVVASQSAGLVCFRL